MGYKSDYQKIGAEPGDVIHVDTDDRRQQNKFTWIGKTIGAAGPWTAHPMIDFRPGYTTISIYWPMPPGIQQAEMVLGQVVCDSAYCVQGPEDAVRSIVFMYALQGIDTRRGVLIYSDPDDHPPVPPKQEDWQLPNPHIGPPIFGYPGAFQFKWTGEAIGSRYTSASGRVYQLVYLGVNPNSTMPYGWAQLVWLETTAMQQLKQISTYQGMGMPHPAGAFTTAALALGPSQLEPLPGNWADIDFISHGYGIGDYIPLKPAVTQWAQRAQPIIVADLTLQDHDHKDRQANEELPLAPSFADASPTHSE